MKLQDFSTLAEAREAEQVRGAPIARNSMNAVLAQAGLYVALKTIAEMEGHPFRDAMAAFFDATEYTFIEGHPVGDQNIAMLDAMIAANLPESPALAATKPIVMALANPVIKPFSGITEHEWALANETMTRKTVTPVNGWLQVTYTKDVEQHAPNLWIYHEDIDHLERVGGIGVVGAAKTYIVRAPVNVPMLIDDAYDAVV